MEAEEIQDIKEQLSACNKGNHSLMTIYEENEGNDMGVSVKWCTKCGSVVGDGVADNRTYPGRYQSMVGPGLYMIFKNK